MPQLILCLKQDCVAELKYTEDPFQFMQVGGQHFGHTYRVLEDLHDGYNKQNDSPLQQYNYETIQKEMDIQCEENKKQISFQIDLINQNDQKCLQDRIDKDRIYQIYQAVIAKDIHKVQQFQDIFYLFNEPDAITQVCLENIEDARNKMLKSQKIFNDILARFAQLRNDHQNDVIYQLKNQIEQKQIKAQSDNNYLLQKVNIHNEKLQALLDLGQIDILQTFDTHQEILNTVNQLLIRQEDDSFQLIQLIISFMKEHGINDEFGLIKQNEFLQQFAEVNLITKTKFQNIRTNMKDSVQAFQQELHQNEVEDRIQTYQSFKFSSQHKHSTLSIIEPYTIRQKMGIGLSSLVSLFYSSFAVLLPSLDEDIARPVTFGFKIKKQEKGIAVGVCHLDTVSQKKYDFNNRDSLGHGSYMISSSGYTYSTTDSEFNSALKSFKFTQNDIIYCTFDPFSKSITYKKGSSGESCKLSYQPTSQKLHPCVCMWYYNDEVEFIQPVLVNEMF